MIGELCISIHLKTHNSSVLTPRCDLPDWTWNHEKSPLQIDQLTNEQQSLQLELVSVYEELDSLRPLKKLQSDYKKTLEKIDTYESHKEEWQSELSKAMDNLELTKAELSNVNNQVRSLIQSLMKESYKIRLCL